MRSADWCATRACATGWLRSDPFRRAAPVGSPVCEARGDPRRGCTMSRPRVLFVGRGRFRFPLGRTLERRVRGTLRRARLAATRDFLDGKQSPDSRLVLARPSAIRSSTVSLLLADAATDRARAPWFPAGRRHRAGRAGGGSRAHRSAPHAIEDRGDPRSPRRLARAGQALRVEGPPPTRPFADALARIALRRTDAVRTISAYTTELVRAEGIEPTAEFPAFMDLEPFTALPVAPLPDARALRRCARAVQAFDVLADAWRRLVPAAPEATLHVVGQGALASMAQQLVDELPDRIEWSPSRTTGRHRGRARRLDAARAPVSLGGDGARGGRSRVPWPGRCGQPRGRHTGRVVLDGETGLLVPPDDAGALAEALIRVLADRALAERLGSAGHRAVAPWLVTPQEYAQRVRNLVEKVVAAS